MLRNYIALFSALLLMGGAAHAVTLTPDDLVAQADFVAGTTSFAWDWDEAAPIGSFAQGGAPGYGTSSWWSNVDGSAAGTGRDYTALRLFLDGDDLFGDPVTMGDLESISYWTLNADPSLIDWQIKIYTAPLTGQTSGWYGHRFNFDRPTSTTTDWTQHTTDAGTNQLLVDWIRSGDGTTSIYPASTALSDLSSAYADETIMWIDIIAGYASSSPPVDSYLDGVELTVSGETVALDLEAVPEPISMAMLGALGAGMFGAARFRRKKR